MGAIVRSAQNEEFWQRCDSSVLETMEATRVDGWRAPGGIMRLFIPSNGNRESSGGDCVEVCGEFLWAVTFLQGSSLYWLYSSLRTTSYAQCGRACIWACSYAGLVMHLCMCILYNTPTLKSPFPGLQNIRRYEKNTHTSILQPEVVRYKFVMNENI